MATTLELLTHDALLPLAHGFFTRKGGASSGIFQGLNCGQGSSDQSEAVAVNRARVADRLGVTPAALVGVHQVHSADAVIVTEPFDKPPRADGLVTDRPGLALTVLTADCQPVLLADPEAGVIGAAHAGWRGAFDGVLEATIEAMHRQGAEHRRICVAIGPCIAQASYEVGPEFHGRFHAADAGNARFFRPSPGRPGHFRFDLPGYVGARLADAGIRRIEQIGHDTCAQDEAYFSYRRSVLNGEPDYGRNISIIALEG